MAERSVAVMKKSRTQRRASGIFVPSLASAVTSRQLHCLLAKWRNDNPESSTCTEDQPATRSQWYCWHTRTMASALEEDESDQQQLWVYVSLLLVTRLAWENLQ